MFKFLPTSSLKWIDPKEFGLNNYTKRCVLEVNLETPKELYKLHNDYPLGPDKTDIKKGILPGYRLKIAHFYKILTGSVKKLVSNIFEKLRE